MLLYVALRTVLKILYAACIKVTLDLLLINFKNFVNRSQGGMGKPFFLVYKPRIKSFFAVGERLVLVLLSNETLPAHDQKRMLKCKVSGTCD